MRGPCDAKSPDDPGGGECYGRPWSERDCFRMTQAQLEILNRTNPYELRRKATG